MTDLYIATPTQANCDLNKEIEAAYERIHQLTIKIEEMF